MRIDKQVAPGRGGPGGGPGGNPGSGRGQTRQRVLEAAEQLMRASGTAEFSMRELAAAAGMSFATPFNQFGSKAAIMQALSARRIDLMLARLPGAVGDGDAADRVLSAVDVAVGVLLEEAVASRAVLGSLGAPASEPGQVSAHSRALWALALEGLQGIVPPMRGVARDSLPDQLAVGFRGCLSFWVAREIEDAALCGRARAAAATLMLGFVAPARRAALVAMLGG